MAKVGYLRTIFLVLIAGILVGCYGGGPSRFNNRFGVTTNYTECRLAADQGTGSLYGSWGSVPVPIVIDKDFYVTDGGRVVTQIRNAVETWNAWYRLKGGRELLRVVDDGTGVNGGRDIPNGAVSSCSMAAYTSLVTDAVGIWKIRGYGDGINRRESCGTQEKLLIDGIQGVTDWIVSGGRISGAAVLLNFDAWNVPGRESVDMESLVLHELGHVVGLLHSCNPGTGTDITGAAGCASAPIEYEEAVMYPALDVGQIRRFLMPNDYARINCLY